MLQFTDDKFRDKHEITIGIEFASKTIELNNKLIKFQIWDTAGQENYRSITRAYYKNSVCALLVYDITNRDSFEHISSWIEDCLSQSPKTVFMVLVGNKSDLEDKRRVTTEEGQQMAKNHNMIFYETSAKTGDNVDKIFEESAKEINKKINEGYYDLESDVCGIKKGLNTGAGTGVFLSGGNNSSGTCCF